MPVDTRSSKLNLDDEEVVSLFKTALLSEEVKMFFQKIVEESVIKETRKLLLEIENLKADNQQLLQKVHQVAVDNNSPVKTINKENVNKEIKKPKRKVSIPKKPPKQNDEKDQISNGNAMIINLEQDNITVNPDENLPNNTDEEGFTKVEYKKKRKPTVRGNGPKSNQLQCAESKVWIFLGRCAKQTTVENVQNYLGEQYPDYEFIVESLESKGRFESFRIGADPTLEEHLYNQDKWPKGAIVSRYFFRRQSARFNK